MAQCPGCPTFPDPSGSSRAQLAPWFLRLHWWTCPIALAAWNLVIASAGVRNTCLHSASAGVRNICFYLQFTICNLQFTIFLWLALIDLSQCCGTYWDLAFASAGVRNTWIFTLFVHLRSIFLAAVNWGIYHFASAGVRNICLVSLLQVGATPEFLASFYFLDRVYVSADFEAPDCTNWRASLQLPGAVGDAFVLRQDSCGSVFGLDCRDSALGNCNIFIVAYRRTTPGISGTWQPLPEKL